MYYKIVKNASIVDAMQEIVYIRQNPINKVIITCAPEFANGIMSSDGTVFWHLEGMPEFSAGQFDTVAVVEIDENEYNAIRGVLDAGADVDDVNDETIREPLTTAQAMELIEQMQKQLQETQSLVVSLENQIAEMKAQNAT